MRATRMDRPYGVKNEKAGIQKTKNGSLYIRGFLKYKESY